MTGVRLSPLAVKKSWWMVGVLLIAFAVGTFLGLREQPQAWPYGVALVLLFALLVGRATKDALIEDGPVLVARRLLWPPVRILLDEEATASTVRRFARGWVTVRRGRHRIDVPMHVMSGTEVVRRGRLEALALAEALGACRGGREVAAEIRRSQEQDATAGHDGSRADIDHDADTRTQGERP